MCARAHETCSVCLIGRCNDLQSMVDTIHCSSLTEMLMLACDMLPLWCGSAPAALHTTVCILLIHMKGGVCLQAGQSLGRRSAPAPAPTPALATAFGPATASQEAGISLIATAPQAAPAPSVSEGPARAPAPAPAAAHQAAAIQMPATAFAPVAASQAASISTTPAPASASQEAINTTSVTSLEANQTTRELYDTQVNTHDILSFQWPSLLLLSCITHIAYSACTCISAAKSSSASSDMLSQKHQNTQSLSVRLKS